MSWSRPAVRRLAVLVVAGAVLLLGVAYSALRDQQYESRATVTLVPDPERAEDRTILLDAFDRSGTIGTYVELIGSRNVIEEAGSPTSSIAVRAIPDTRVIEITATGEQASVQQDLNAVIGAAAKSGPDLGDLWRLQVLESPGVPALAGPSSGALFGATILLAVLAGIVTFVLLGGGSGRPRQPVLRAVVPDERRTQPPPDERTKAAAPRAP